MMSERENYDLIEKYLTQDLSESEIQAFETRAKSDPEFAEQVILHTLAKKEMEAAASAELRERLRASFPKAQKSNVISMHRDRRKWLSLAAVIILLIVCIPLLRNILTPSYVTSDEIYVEHFQSPDLLASNNVRGENGKINNEEVWERALKAINENRPEEAIQQFDTLMNDSLFMKRFNNTIIYQTGVAWLLNKNPEKAISYFDQVEPQSPFGATARWYKGMAYLKIDNRAKALEVFNEAIDDPAQKPSRREEAKKITEKLKID